jgi:GntP family gluconate:H+ symporter
VLAATRLRVHPFLALLGAAIVAGFAYGVPAGEIVALIGGGFGGILGSIGIVIALGTIVGVILERSGGAIAIAEGVVRTLGQRFPTLTISTIGAIVSIPVFCDSGFVILNALKNAMAARMRVSVVAMSVALATGLYATHIFVPPTPGPIAAAGNLGLEASLGLVILVGLPIAAVAALAGVLWANRFRDAEDMPLLEEGGGATPEVDAAHTPDSGGVEDVPNTPTAAHCDAIRSQYGTLPGVGRAIAPIAVPIALICLGSIAALPSRPLGEGGLFDTLRFLGQPAIALAVGVALACTLLRGRGKRQQFHDQVAAALRMAAPILLITGAGGAFAAVLKATALADELGGHLSALGIGIFMPFLLAAALKTAQGSSTVALVATSALVAPLLGDLGLDSEIGRVLTVMAIGAGAMTVSHANDSFFWVVTQFSRMSVPTAFRAQTVATLIQGLAAMLAVWLASVVLL